MRSNLKRTAMAWAMCAAVGSTALAQETATPAPTAAAAPAPATDPEASKDFDPGKYVANFLTGMGIPITLGGYFWVDTGYLTRLNAPEDQTNNLNSAYMQGRFVLAAGMIKEFGDFYGLARVELLGLVNEYSKNQYEPHTLDAYVKLGHKRWGDLQVGRFLAWEVYHRGQGIELFTAEEAGAYHAPALYWLQNTRGYVNEPGQAAIHFFPFDFLKFEVAGVYGQEGSSKQNDFGVRPVAVLDLGGLEVIGGYEYFRVVPQNDNAKVESTTHGVAGKVQYTFPVVTVGGNVGWSDVQVTDINGLQDTSKSGNTLSFGAFVDIDFWRNSIGLGYHRTNATNIRLEHNWQDQAFLSYLVRLPMKGLAVKAVYGLSHAHLQTVDNHTTWDNYQHSVRVRISYDLD